MCPKNGGITVELNLKIMKSINIIKNIERKCVKKMKEEKKSFLLANTSFYPSTGGVETTLRGMIEGLVQDGHSVTVVSGNRSNTTSQPQKKYEELFGAKVYRYKVIPFFLYYVTAISLLIKIRKDNSFDGVISRSYPTTICLWFAGYKNIKYVAPATYSLQNHPRFTSGNKIKRYISYLINSSLEKFSLFILKEVFVFSSEMKKQIKQLSKNKKITKIFPGVDKKRFKVVAVSEKFTLRKKHSVPTDKKVLLFIGRAEKVKNSLDAIRVLKYLPANYITVYVGEGSEKAAAEELCIKERLQDRVIFYNFTNTPEEFFQLADFFLMTSVYEPFGQVILEALSCGAQVFGYVSSKNIQTATTEIFYELGIDSSAYLSDFKVENMAMKIANYKGQYISFNSKVYGWNEFVYRLIK